MRIEIRENQVLLDGYVNAVDRESRVLPSPKGRFVEKIVPKTFERALQKASDVELRFNHNKNRKLGSIKEGNLELYEDNIGLRAIAKVSDDEIIQKAQNGELRGWSFGFISNKDRWEDGENGIQRRFIEDLDLLEVSILDKTPAYIATSIESRGEEEAISETRGADFKAKIEDFTKEEQEEKRENVVYSLYEKEIEFLKLKGGK
ncbi:HK97 family phage prohead protease [Lysinibacillus sp. RS5]|uniref:HK97 family phage prohead protease n=1 Tax=unclassified Lysinibacillus TaxID=2636778 RepID=UPI0035BE4657